MKDKNAWQKLAGFFESGDLTPVAVVISVAHYGPVLTQHGDNLFIAWLVGMVIDMLHFRSVRFAVRSGGVHWVIAVMTTFMALAYHMRFYGNDILLAAPIPIGVGILAYHAAKHRQEQVINWQTKVKEAQISAKEAQENADTAQRNADTAQASASDRDELAKRCEDLQNRVNEWQTAVKAWQTMNDRYKAITLYNARLITKTQAIEMSGMSKRTVEMDAGKMNGVAK